MEIHQRVSERVAAGWSSKEWRKITLWAEPVCTMRFIDIDFDDLDPFIRTLQHIRDEANKHKLGIK